MSVCSNKLRALSRSRLSTSKTLLPFLYRTPTIQQWIRTRTSMPRVKRVPQDALGEEIQGLKDEDEEVTPFADEPSRTQSSTARRRFEPREHLGNDIPFEYGDSLSTADRARPARKTTLTGPERAAFQKLYRKSKAKEWSRGDDDHKVELDQIADEYYEDDEEPAPPSVDKMFDEMYKGGPWLRKPGAPAQEPGEPKLSKAKLEALQFKNLKLAERSRIDTLIETAPTDRALWQIVERELLDPIRKLDLDSIPSTTNPRHKPNPKLKPKPKQSDEARALFQNYPGHLITAVVTLRTAFPTSSLPLAILPTIQSIGRSAHALGVTTALYRHIMRCVWLQHASYSRIDQLLKDMINGAIEFDSGVLELLDTVIQEHEMARAGQLGNEMQLVYGMEQFLDGIKQIKRWRGLVAERLGIRQGEARRVAQWRKENNVADAEDDLQYPSRQTAGREIEAARMSDGDVEDVPLVDGLDETGGGLQELSQELANEREAELLMDDLDLDGMDSEEIQYRANAQRDETRRTDDGQQVGKIML